MHKVALHYALTHTTGDRGLRHPLMDLLAAVARGGSISAAARDLGMSYRHAWGELKRWEGELANPLIIWGKGQSARLTEFGSKLLWAERQAQARLAPQIEALRAELERTFAVAFDPHAHVLSLYASHDEALVTLREFAARHGQENGLHLDIRPAATLDALRALNEGRCIMAALHAPAAIAPRSPLAAAYKPLLRPGQHKIIGFVERTQGLMVAAGNPLRIGSLTDVARSGARFVGRAGGSGTRYLTQTWLSREGLTESDLCMADHAEPSHAAAAQALAAGLGDVAVGIESAARAQGLGFVPLEREAFHLVCLKSELEQPAVRALRTLLARADWQQHLVSAAGCEPARSGQVLSLRAVMPWWNLRPKAAVRPSDFAQADVTVR